MYPLFESIKVVDKNIFHFEEHYLRMKNSSKALWKQEINFSHLENEIKAISKTGLQKCKILYNQDKYIIEVHPYHKRKINCIHLVENDKIEYKYKYTNRSELLQLASKLLGSKEIIIIQNKLMTDTSYSNIALWNGEEWHTPRTPLFAGIKRKILIEQKCIHEKDILSTDLHQYQKISLINALLDLGELEIKIENIIG